VAQHCNETVTLGLYDRDRRQCLRIDQIPTSHPLNYVVRLDEWTDICHGASGLSIMAFLPADEQEYHQALAESLARPESPWLSRRNLEPEIAEIRHNGYACTHGRRLVGAVGLGAPIYGMGETVIGSLVISIPEVRWHLHDEADLAQVVKDAAAGITSMMAGRRQARH
jgi:DNA-binding IclR family transcriptional regulator